MYWLWRGFQSAVFYYFSCAPCAKISYHRRRRKQTKRGRTESEKVATEMMEQGIYQHPSPFSTNIYWREEMVLGPGPPPKNRNRDRSKTESSRGLRSGGVGSSSITGTSSDTVVEDEASRIISEAGHDRRSGEDWNKRRYQRDDEILWGDDTDDEDGTGIANRNGIGSYYYSRNPAVNDLHPPVVSKVSTRRSETRWMLQPPPSARIMEGKERLSSRSRSGSGVSSKSGDSNRKRDDVSLGRKVGERLMEEKVRRGEYPSISAATSTSMLRVPSGGSFRSSEFTHSPQGHRHDRETFLSPSPSLSTSSPIPPSAPPSSSSSSSAPPTTSSAPPTTSGLNPHSPRQRPPLPTIKSSSLQTRPTTLQQRNSSASLPPPSNKPLSSLPPPLDPHSADIQHPITDFLSPPLLFRTNAKKDERQDRVEMGWWWPVDWEFGRQGEDSAGRGDRMSGEGNLLRGANGNRRVRRRWSMDI